MRGYSKKLLEDHLNTKFNSLIYTNLGQETWSYICIHLQSYIQVC